MVLDGQAITYEGTRPIAGLNLLNRCSLACCIIHHSAVLNSASVLATADHQAMPCLDVIQTLASSSDSNTSASQAAPPATVS